MPKPPRSIISLPTEIQAEVFSYLTDMESQSAIYETCPLWRRILTEYSIFHAARYYRGRAPYIYFPVVHRFFDISPRGNGRCQVENGEIINYQYKTDTFGYMDVSGMVRDDPMFSPIYGHGWWAPKRIGTADLIRMYRSRVEVTEGVEIIGTSHYGDAQGTLFTALHAEPDDNKESNDAIWMHIKVGHEYQREIDEPQSSAWERIALPKLSTIKDWTEAILNAAKLRFRTCEALPHDFDIDFREAFIKPYPAEGWCLDIWIILPESLENKLARLQNDLRNMQVKRRGSRDRNNVLVLAII